VIRHTAIKSDPPPHFSQRRCSIADAKRFPGQRGRQDVGPCKNASTNDEVSRRVQLEQKKLAGAQGLHHHLGYANGRHWDHGWHNGRYGWWWGGDGLGWTYHSDPWWGYPDYGTYDYNQPYASQSWYYCSDPAGYYPYVTQCNTNWQTVPAS
jgi:hypothetical protein